MAELLALGPGARGGIRPGCVPPPEVHRRSDGSQRGAVSSRPQLFLLAILQEELGAAVQDVPGVCVGAVPLLQRL